MKKIQNEKSLQGLKELSMEETTTIIGGESLWYWVGYGLGYTGYIITHRPGE